MGEYLHRLPGRGEPFDDLHAMLTEGAVGCDVLGGDRVRFVPRGGGACGGSEWRRPGPDAIERPAQIDRGRTRGN
jgi:hypothetical protein